MIKHKIFSLAFYGLIVLLTLGSCKDEPKGTTDQEKPQLEEKKYNRPIPRFQADSSYAFVKKQVEFGTRVPGSPGHQACKVWLSDKLKSFGATVIEQNFDAKIYTGETLKATNIIGQYNPSSKKRVLLCAHWDSRHIAEKDPDPAMKDKPILGADDGASGVGVLLEIARLVGESGLDMGLDIIFFDAEDNGESSDTPNTTEAEYLRSRNTWCLGSQYWGSNLHVPGYKAKFGILLDMVGSKNARFPRERYSAAYAPSLLNKTWKLGKSMGFGNHFVDKLQGPITDDHLFVYEKTKIPIIDIINLSEDANQTFGDYHHTHDDNLDIIDVRTLKAVGRVVTAVLYRENNGSF